MEIARKQPPPRGAPRQPKLLPGSWKTLRAFLRGAVKRANHTIRRGGNALDELATNGDKEHDEGLTPISPAGVRTALGSGNDMPPSIRVADALITNAFVLGIISGLEFRGCMWLVSESKPLAEPINAAMMIKNEVRRELRRRKKRVNADTLEAICIGIECGVRKGGLNFPEPEDAELEKSLQDLERQFVAAEEQARQWVNSLSAVQRR